MGLERARGRVAGKDILKSPEGFRKGSGFTLKEIK
jgi:hypothetical protein